MLKFLKENKKIFAIIFMLFAIYSYGAGEFDGVNKVVENLDESATSAAGTGLKWFMGLLPLLLFVAGLFLGFKHSKKQADQDNESNKVFLTALIGGVIGAIVGIAVDALIGVALMGSSDSGLKVLRDFWTGALGVGGGTVTTPTTP